MHGLVPVVSLLLLLASTNAFQSSWLSSRGSFVAAFTASPQKSCSWSLDERQSVRVTVVGSNHRRCRQRFSQVQLRAVSAHSNVRDQLGLFDRFDRWRFLQNLLDEDTTADDTTLVLFAMLDGFVKSPFRPSYKRGSDETASPSLTNEIREIIETVLQDSSARVIQDLLEGRSDNVSDDVAISVEPSATDRMSSILAELEKLLPDPIDDEDAFKGLWDTVIELNGRESVKINEGNGTRQWKTRCLIARVLLYYDFLSEGV